MRNSALISETWHVFLFYRKELIWNEVDNMTVCVDLNFPSAKALQIKITISSLLFSVIPLCIVIPSNVAIIIKLFLHKKYRRSLHANCSNTETTKITVMLLSVTQGRIQGGPGGPGPPLTTKNEAPAPKFYKTEAPEWQF